MSRTTLGFIANSYGDYRVSTITTALHTLDAAATPTVTGAGGLYATRPASAGRRVPRAAALTHSRRAKLSFWPAPA